MTAATYIPSLYTADVPWTKDSWRARWGKDVPFTREERLARKREQGREAARRWKASEHGKAVQAAYRERLRKNPPADLKARRRRHKLKATFGITPDDYDKMVASQGGKCALCGEVLVKMKIHHPVDHCHKTGAVRGVLHARCNSLIGWIEKHSDKLPLVNEYLKKHGGG